MLLVRFFVFCEVSPMFPEFVKKQKQSQPMSPQHNVYEARCSQSFICSRSRVYGLGLERLTCTPSLKTEWWERRVLFLYALTLPDNPNTWL